MEPPAVGGCTTAVLKAKGDWEAAGLNAGDDNPDRGGCEVGEDVAVGVRERVPSGFAPRARTEGSDD